MVRLRKLGSEFHSPDDFRAGALLTMPYLDDFVAYQDYLDGDLSPLFERFLGNATTQDVTGSAYYAGTEGKGYYRINLFRSVARYLEASVFERSPAPIEEDDAVTALWEDVSPLLLRVARQAVLWYCAMGRGVIKVDNRFGTATPIAVPPKDYLPLVDPIDRDLQVGHAIVRRWYDGPRVPQYDTPNKATVEIYITEEQAAVSDGRVRPTNERMDFIWSGNQGQGVIAGQFGAETQRVQNQRLLGVWSFGHDDSLFATMEPNVYEFILALTHARTALTQDVRSYILLPKVSDPEIVDPMTGKVTVQRLRPQYQVPPNEPGTNSTSLGYVTPPGPAQAQAFRELADMMLDTLAYTANVPREAFGLNMQANESGEALVRLQQVWRTMVIDIRDDLSKILSEVFQILTGTEAQIGWEHEPFAKTVEMEDRIILQYDKKLISQANAQARLGLPIEKIEQNPEGGDRNGVDSGPGSDELPD